MLLLADYHKYYHGRPYWIKKVENTSTSSYVQTLELGQKARWTALGPHPYLDSTKQWKATMHYTPLRQQLFSRLMEYLTKYSVVICARVKQLPIPVWLRNIMCLIALTVKVETYSSQSMCILIVNEILLKDQTVFNLRQDYRLSQCVC